MCIIVYKPENTRFPSNEILETCFRNNPDGAGFMYPDKDGVHIRKGFMKYKDFKRAIKFLKSKNVPVVMHFRISTHAGVTPEMTQPFPITGKTRKLKSLESLGRVGVAHNGIIPMTSDAKTISDTALFVKRYMSYLIKGSQYYKDSRISEMIEEMINSRMAILSKDGHVEILGKGWIEEDGIWYSNSSYLDIVSRYNSYYYDWGDYDDECYYYKPKHKKNTDIPEEELEDWMQWREDCPDRLESRGASCFGCDYEDFCYAI